MEPVLSTNRLCDTRYEYKALKSTSAIRLLVLAAGEPDDVIRCSLTHEILSDKPHYQALSYVWGDSSQTCEIYCEASLLMVAPSR